MIRFIGFKYNQIVIEFIKSIVRKNNENIYLMGLISEIYYQNLIKCMNEINNAIQKAIMRDCVRLKKDLFNKGTLILIYKCMIHRKQDCMIRMFI